LVFEQFLTQFFSNLCSVPDCPVYISGHGWAVVDFSGLHHLVTSAVHSAILPLSGSTPQEQVQEQAAAEATLLRGIKALRNRSAAMLGEGLESAKLIQGCVR
jgi:hypothetical protein